jgi:membrane-bound metal-dependent hydrolase YbcI (DUF457 family)
LFAVGHFALGYLTGKASSKLFKAKMNLPLILVVSVLPDIDLILQFIYPALFMHRGPTHSIITFTVLMLPLFIVYKRQAIPYYAALLSHSLIGDYFTGGVELFWPISKDWFEFVINGRGIDVRSLGSVIAELTFFFIMLLLMLRSKELQSLLKPQKTNLALIIAFGAILGPLLSAGRGSETSLPALLIIPSLFWLVILAYLILLELKHRLKPPRVLTAVDI